MSKNNRLWKISEDIVIETYDSLINIYDLGEKIDIDLHWSEAEKLIPVLKEAIVEVKSNRPFEVAFHHEIKSLPDQVWFNAAVESHVVAEIRKSKKALMEEIMLDRLSVL